MLKHAGKYRKPILITKKTNINSNLSANALENI